MRKIAFVCCLFSFFCGSLQAEISAENLPSMGNLGLLIGQTDPAEIDESVYSDGGRISAGMPVKDLVRGRTATELATLLGQGNEEREQALVDGIDQARAGFEDYLRTANFEPFDLGVALAASFIVLWEVASDKTLPDESALKAGKYLVHTFEGTKSKFAASTEEDKAALYDWLMTTPVAMVALVDSYQQAGHSQEVSTLRSKSGELFKQLFLMEHDFFILQNDGEFLINQEKIQQYQEEELGLSEGW